jgi:hypothetical protein
LVLRTARCPAQRPPSPQRHERDRRSGIQQRREGHWKLPEGLIEGLMKPIPSRTPESMPRINVRNIYIYLYNVKFKQCVDLPSRSLDVTPSPTVTRSGADQVAHRGNRAVLRTVGCRKECKRDSTRCRDSVSLLLVPVASASGEAETVARQHHPR